MSTPVERIFSLLKVKEIEQKEFAQLLGTTDKTVSAWKTGRSQSYTKYLPKISETLGTTVEYLLTGDEKKPAAEDSSGREKEFVQLFEKLTPEQQDMVLAQLKGVLGSQGN